MGEPLVCWKCGAAVENEPLPLSRRAVCRACGAELHVCRMCVFYDPRITGACREERAEEVREKELANFCDWFKPRPDAYTPADTARSDAAAAQLAALFGEGDGAEEAAAGDDARRRLEDLFKS